MSILYILMPVARLHTGKDPALQKGWGGGGSCGGVLSVFFKKFSVSSFHIYRYTFSGFPVNLLLISNAIISLAFKKSNTMLQVKKIV